MVSTHSTSSPHARLSAHAQPHGAFDYNRTPLAPTSTRVFVHEEPSTRGTWAPHTVEGYTLRPDTNHYRCYRVWINDTSVERIVDTVAQPPEPPSNTKTPLWPQRCRLDPSHCSIDLGNLPHTNSGTESMHLNQPQSPATQPPPHLPAYRC
jgi:hypothetical protein